MSPNPPDEWKSARLANANANIEQAKREKPEEKRNSPPSRSRTKGKTAVIYLLLMLLAAGVIAISSSSSLVSAQPCQAQFGVPNIYSLNYYPNDFRVAVPVLGTCSFEPFLNGEHLYATTAVVDLKSNATIGAGYTILVPDPPLSGYGFTGYIDLALPLAAQYDQLQFFVAVYSNQGGYSAGTLLTTASSTFLLGSSYYQSYPSYPYYPAPYPTPTSPYYPGNSCNYNCGYLPPSVSASCYYPGPQAYPNYPYYPTHPC